MASTPPGPAIAADCLTRSITEVRAVAHARGTARGWRAMAAGPGESAFGLAIVALLDALLRLIAAMAAGVAKGGVPVPGLARDTVQLDGSPDAVAVSHDGSTAHAPARCGPADSVFGPQPMANRDPLDERADGAPVCEGLLGYSSVDGKTASAQARGLPRMTAASRRLPLPARMVASARQPRSGVPSPARRRIWARAQSLSHA